MTTKTESSQITGNPGENGKLKFRRQGDGTYLVVDRFLVKPAAGEIVAGEILPSAKWHLTDLKLSRGRDVGGLNEARDVICEVLRSENI